MKLETLLAKQSRNERLVAQFAGALTRLQLEHGHSTSTILAGLVGNVVAVVKASAPPNEWQDAARILSAEITSQLTDI